MKMLRFIKSYIILVLAAIILLGGFWADYTTETDMFPASMFTVPYFIFLTLLGWLYFYLHKNIKNGLMFWLKEVAFLYATCCALYFLGLMIIDNFSSDFSLLRDTLSLLESKLARYLFGITQSVALALFVITIINKNKS